MEGGGGGLAVPSQECGMMGESLLKLIDLEVTNN